ncbi:MAG: RluA family pseudouridine synthase [Bacteroidetes bacterium]|nr:RluA family pseudouridine synthase [Bacteroidota bacterium]
MPDAFIEETEDWEDESGEPEAPTEQAERMRIRADKGQELLRIDKFLMTRIEGATRNKVQQALEEGNITVNGTTVKANYKVRPGDEIIVLETRRPDLSEIIPEQLPLNIKYEDDAVIVVNKPAGLVVHPGCGNYRGTLVNGLAWYLQQHEGPEATLPRVGLVHRIDKDTSGLLLIAKTEQAMMKLAAQFKAHTVHRRYVALVWGDMEAEEGRIESHIGRHQRFRKIFAAYPDGEHGKEAITDYRVLERFGYVSLVELQLKTGRTHQIRVHMQSIGHPLFGDRTYGGDRIVKGTVFSKYKQFVENTLALIPRQALHAKELGFVHPETGEKMCFKSELPEDIEAAIERWRSYTKGLVLKTE